MKEPTEQARLQHITVIAPGIVWMGVLGNLRLALRHPENMGPSTEMIRRFAGLLGEKLAAEGVLSVEEYAAILREEMLARNGKGKA